MPVSRLKQFLKIKFCHADWDYQTKPENMSLVESNTVKGKPLCGTLRSWRFGAKFSYRQRQIGLAPSRRARKDCRPFSTEGPFSQSTFVPGSCRLVL
jgi:hypothetical protein